VHVLLLATLKQRLVADAALLQWHGQRHVDRLGRALGVVGVDQQRAAQLLGGAGMAARSACAMRVPR
jgi:hypothetical protein